MNKNNENGIIPWLLRNYRITFLLVGLLFLFGLYGLEKMPKAEFPTFTMRQAMVIAVYPGATTGEVEQQVARPLERFLFEFKEVNRHKTITTSRNGICLAMVELHDDIDDSDEVWSKIKHGINGLKSTLPQGVLAVVCQDDFGDTNALLIAIESDERSYRELHKYADDLSDQIRRIPSVSRVRTYGDIPEQISIYIDRQCLSAYGISDKMLMAALNANSSVIMSGNVSTPKNNTPIHISSPLNSVDEIGNIIIYTDPANNMVRVKDIARIEQEYDLSTSFIEQNGHPCVLLSAEMVPGNNIVQFGNDVNSVMDEFITQQMPDDVKITRISDQPEVVGKSVSDFLRDLIISMIIIIVVMMILFPWRTAVVAAITVPLTTFISIGIMYAAGIELNIITLAALIIVLGMVVDNSIVVLDGYLEYLDKGMGRWQAAAQSAKQYFMPMLLATVCVCAIFFPFLFTFSGMEGDFIKFLPWTITINLIVSLLLAVVIIPPLEAMIIRKPKVRNGNKRSITDHVQYFYNKVLNWTFRHPWLTITGGVCIVALSLTLAPQLKIRPMPYADREQLAVEIFLPEGSGLDDTKAIADSVYGVLKSDSRVEYVTSFIGCSSPRFMTSYAPQPGGKNFAQFIVATHSNDETLSLWHDMDERLANRYPNAFVKFKRLDYQIPETFEFRFYGENLDSLQIVANRLMAYMRKNSDLENVHTNYGLQQSIAEITLDPVAASQMGFNKTTTSLAIALQTSDIQVGSIWEDDYELPVIIKDEYNGNIPLGVIGNLPLGMSTSQLRQIADVGVSWQQEQIVHRNGLRCISVTAEHRPGITADPIEADIEDYIADELEMPDGVRFEVGGNTENTESYMLPMVSGGLIISMLIIFFFLLFSFRRYGLTLVSIAAIALALPGMLTGLWLMDRMLGLTSIFGIVTLMGIIMRNEILIFEHADDCRAKGMSVRDAAYDAGRRRMVPIFLTTATTAVGVVPMIIAQSSFWMPVGVTIFAGGIGALILVVTVLPVTYWKLYAKQDKK